MTEKKCVAVNPITQDQYTDHLAPMCVIMDMPLLMADEEKCIQAETLYPGIKPIFVNWLDITPEYLIENFDVFFQSHVWNRKKFYQKFEALEKEYGKSVRNVHCPHGFSDKTYWFSENVWEDIVLIYGENMLDMFREMEIDHHLNQYVISGNYRYDYYLNNKKFFDDLMYEKIDHHFSKKSTTILYAPSWMDGGGSFFDSDPIFSLLPDDYNLIVKFHPLIEARDPIYLYYLMGQYGHKKNILFITDLPLVYPLLARTDIYIGDTSSIGYDFLAFNKPMFFLNQRRLDSKTDRNAYLNKCGTELFPEDYPNIYSIIEKSLNTDDERFSKIRTQMYAYTFGKSIPKEILKAEILKACDMPKKYA